MVGKLRSHRLRKTWDFQKILRRRQKVYNENFVIFYGRNPRQENLCRFGISIPQKIVRKVVLRNKYKRQTKHLLVELQRERTGEWSSFKGWDFLIIIRKEFTTRDFSIKKDSLEDLFKLFTRKVINRQSIANKTFSKKQEGAHD